jgi:hypothetical protein
MHKRLRMARSGLKTFTKTQMQKISHSGPRGGRPARAQSGKKSRKSNKGGKKTVKIVDIRSFSKAIPRRRGAASAVQSRAAPVSRGYLIRQPTSSPFSGFVHAKHGPGIRISGRSWLCNLEDNSSAPNYGPFSTTSGSATFYSRTTFFLNPNLFNTNLELIGECFTYFRFVRAKLDIVPACSTASNGSAIYGYTEDPALAFNQFGDVPGTDTRLAQVPKSADFAYWMKGSASMVRQPDPDQWWYVYPTASMGSMTYADWRMVLQGAFIGAISLPNDDLPFNYGKAYLDYTVEFVGLVPASPSPLLANTPRGAFAAGLRTYTPPPAFDFRGACTSAAAAIPPPFTREPGDLSNDSDCDETFASASAHVPLRPQSLAPRPRLPGPAPRS